MDILSDVNVVGSLTVSSQFFAGLIGSGTYAGRPAMSVDSKGTEVHLVYETHFNCVFFYGCVDYRKNECHSGMEYHNGVENHSGYEKHNGFVDFNNNVAFKGDLEIYTFTRGNCISFNTDKGGVGSVSVNVPANCQKFLIKSFVMKDMGSNYTDDTLTDDQLFFPSVTAWCGRKKVEVDLEICISSMGSAYTFTEFLVASVTPSSSSREMRFALSYL